MEKEYVLFGWFAKVNIQEGLVGIVNDRSLRRMVGPQPELAAVSLVDLIKADYAAIYGTALLIADDSFIVEIWGHLYFDYFLLKYKTVLRFILLFGLYDRLCRSCEVIDCGERGKDPNRRVWDAIARYRRCLANWLPRAKQGW